MSDLPGKSLSFEFCSNFDYLQRLEKYQLNAGVLILLDFEMSGPFIIIGIPAKFLKHSTFSPHTSHS